MIKTDLNNNSKDLYSILTLALNDQEKLFQNLNRVGDLVYFNEKKLQLLNQEDIDESDQGFVILLNMKGLKNILEIYDQFDEVLSADQFDESVFSFNNKEEILNYLLKFRNIAALSLLEERTEKLFFNKICFQFDILDHLSISFIYAILPHFYLDTGWYEEAGWYNNDKKLIDARWYKFIVNSNLFKIHPEYAYDLLTRIIQDSGYRLDQLEQNNDFCELLIDLYLKDNQALTSITLYMYQAIKTTVRNKNMNLMANLTTSKKSLQFFNKLLKQLHYNFEDKFSNVKWFYTELGTLLNHSLCYTIYYGSDDNFIDETINSDSDFIIYFSLEFLFSPRSYNMTKYLKKLDDHLVHVFLLKNHYESLLQYKNSLGKMIKSVSENSPVEDEFSNICTLCDFIVDKINKNIIEILSYN